MTRYLPSTAFVLLTVLLLAGCTNRRQESISIQQKTSKAEQLLANNKPKQALQVLQDIPKKQIKFQAHQYLVATEALLKTGDNTGAKKHIEAIDNSQLSTPQINTLKLLTGQLYLSEGNTFKALENFKSIIPRELSNRHQSSYFQSLAFAYALNQQPVESIKAKIALSKFLASPRPLKNNYQAILAGLNQLSEPILAKLETASDSNLSGWAAITRLLKLNRLGSKRFHAAFSDWQYRYPEHAALALDFEDFKTIAMVAPDQPEKIAVLLPESGKYGQAAQAIKAGLVAAINNRSNNTAPVSINYHDTNGADIQSLYRRLVDSGVDLVIGPLQKDNIQRLAQLPTLDVPVLALNQLPQLGKHNLFQFGLSPEQEAEQIAHRAIQDGYRNALILVPDSPQGRRIARAIRNFWQQAGARVLKTKTYNPTNNDYSRPIKQLLNAKKRQRNADVIFIAARPRAARSINPLLRYYQANELPVYAMPQIYTGLPNPSLDLDLDNITFCDLPWLLLRDPQDTLSLQRLQNSWQQFPSAYIRLFAMGIDAYNIVPYLSAMSTDRYPGVTGNLFLNADHHINRELACAKFIGGTPKSLGFNNPNAKLISQ